MNWSRILQAVGFTVLLVTLGAFVVQAFPTLVGADHALVVQSGSMEPTIMTGSVVFAEETSIAEVEEGDIITYRDEQTLITHRVIEAHRGQSSYRLITKGDANDAPDPDPVYRDQVFAKVQFSVPLMGYVVAFANTTMGWLALVLVPTLLLIFNELWSLWKAATAKQTAENER